MSIGTRMFRSILLALAGNPAARSLALKYGLKLGAKQFVAGVSQEEVLASVRDLHARGIRTTLDFLGESVATLNEAEWCRDEYLSLLQSLQEACLDAHISLKPTQMGLALSPSFAYEAIRDIVARAQQTHTFVRLDMESSAYTDDTLALVRRLREEGFHNVGAVIQANLRRSKNDVPVLAMEGINLRLVKGAYHEPALLAYPDKKDVDQSYRLLMRQCLLSSTYTAIATHDEAIISEVKQLARDHQISKDAFEFQMLYGISPLMLQQLANEGYRARCYVPYGRMWYPYFVRRLAERPANALFILRHLLKRSR